MGDKNGQMSVPNNVKKGSISAVITRADGTVINVGKVAHTNRFIHALLQAKLRLYKRIGRI